MKQKLLTLAITCLSFTNVCQAAFPVHAPLNEVTTPAAENHSNLFGAELNNLNSAPIIRKLAPAKMKEKGVGTPVFGVLSFVFGILGWILSMAANSVGILLAFSLIAFILGAIGLGKRLKGLAITGFILGLVGTVLSILVLAGI